MPPWRPIASSTLAATSYDASTRTLQIRFKRGGVYSYSDVPPETVDGLLSASSAGAYFYANIRNAYETTRTS